MQVSDTASPQLPSRSPRPSRRQFVKLLAAAGAAVLAPPLSAAQAQRLLAPWFPGDHPDPRPGIDGSGVLGADELGNAADLIELFDQVREIPHIADGIRCYCGCAHIDGYRSLLTCYEEPGMAQHCEVCQGQARLAHGRWKEGQTLDQIRRATDARFGHAAMAGRADRSAANTHDHG